MRNTSLILLVSALLFSCQQVEQTDQKSKKDYSAINDSLTQKLQLAYQEDAVVGFSVAIVDETGEIYENGFGFTDIEQQQAYTSETIQNIASISKTLIGISLLIAQDAGLLNINDPINKYLPFKVINPNYPDDPILIKHLAYHTSSIIDLDEVYVKSYVLKKDKHAENEGVYEYFNKPQTTISALDFMRNTLSKEGKWYQENTFRKDKPGESREYSNIAAALCALVIESATGQDYPSFTKEKILQPLSMNSSGWSSADIDTTKRSRLFVTKEMMIAEYSLITYADGGFITSSKDLGLYLAELIKGYNGKGTLLSKEGYQALFEKHKFSGPEDSEEYGIFMEFRDEFLGIENNLVGHNGSDPGVVTAMYFNPETGLGKIMIANTDTDYNDSVWPEIKLIWESLSSYGKP